MYGRIRGGMGHAREGRDKRWVREDEQRIDQWYVL